MPERLMGCAQAAIIFIVVKPSPQQGGLKSNLLTLSIFRNYVEFNLKYFK